jgi:hypothetical protein
MGVSMSEFDWENDPAVILRDQAAVAAYYNSSGELVVRQRDSMGCEAVLYVAPGNIPQFLHGLTDRAEHADRPEPVTSVVPASTRLTVIKGGAGE